MDAQNLLNSMKPIRYALWDYKHNKVLSPDDPEWDIDGYIYENCCVLKPDEVWKKKIGTCYDCSLFEYVKLQRLGYSELCVIYLESLNPKREFGTHTAVIFKDQHKNWWYWFEHSWNKFRGIHGPFLDKINAYREIKTAENKIGCKVTLFKTNVNRAFDNLLKLDLITIKDFDKEMDK